jgi:hypothetical protein
LAGLPALFERSSAFPRFSNPPENRTYMKPDRVVAGLGFAPWWCGGGGGSVAARGLWWVRGAICLLRSGVGRLFGFRDAGDAGRQSSVASEDLFVDFFDRGLSRPPLKLKSSVSDVSRFWKPYEEAISCFPFRYIQKGVTLRYGFSIVSREN